MKHLVGLRYFPCLTFLMTILMSCSNATLERTTEQNRLRINNPSDHSFHSNPMNTVDTTITTETATFGGGCFWCTEAVFLQLKGVHKVVSGYEGGHKPNPTYKEVCTGETGHAEVIQITFDPKIIGFSELLEVFFKTHDPTTLNRQGGDEGTQYRSVVFYHNENQKIISENVIKTLNEEKAYPSAVVTQVVASSVFYPAEDYHQNYYNQNSNQGYCAMVIQPKIEKFKKAFKEKLK